MTEIVVSVAVGVALLLMVTPMLIGLAFGTLVMGAWLIVNKSRKKLQ